MSATVAHSLTRVESVGQGLQQRMRTHRQSKIWAEDCIQGMVRDLDKGCTGMTTRLFRAVHLKLTMMVPYGGMPAAQNLPKFCGFDVVKVYSIIYMYAYSKSLSECHSCSAFRDLNNNCTLVIGMHHSNNLVTHHNKLAQHNKA